MIPFVGTAVWYLVLALASYQGYQTTQEAWNTWTDAKDEYKEIKAGFGGLGLLAGGALILYLISSRRSA